MNITATLVCCLVWVWCFSREEMGAKGNLVYVKLDRPRSHVLYGGSSIRPYLGLHSNNYQHVRQQCGQDIRFRRLNLVVCRTIRKLRLNRRGSKGGKQRQQYQNQRPSRHLVPIPITMPVYKCSTAYMTLSTVNTHSVQGKDTLLMDYLLDNKIDFSVLTETWLNDTHEIWLQASEFNKSGYEIINVNRQGTKHGGIAMVCKSCLKPRLVKGGAYRSLEYAL